MLKELFTLLFLSLFINPINSQINENNVLFVGHAYGSHKIQDQTIDKQLLSFIAEQKDILFKNFMDICITTILWWLLGYGMAYGTGEFIGGNKFNTDQYATTDYRDWLFQWAFAGTTMTIVSGCMAERTTIHGYLILTIVMNLLEDIFKFI